MKQLASLILILAATLGLTSCLESDNSMARFDNITLFNGYANTTGGHIAFAAYGDWTMTKKYGGDWATIAPMTGKGNTYYTIPVALQPNETGQLRTIGLHLQDNNEGKVYVDFEISQFATRGDGALGGCAFVKTIDGTDGSHFGFLYDNRGNVAQVRIEKGGQLLRQLDLTFSGDSLLTLRDGSSQMSGAFDLGFQPRTGIKSETDTVGYYQQEWPMATGQNMVSLQRRQRTGEQSGISYLFNNQPGDVDGERKADSIKWFNRKADMSFELIKMKPAYTTVSNRRQNIDANQLLLGTERCNPYALIGLFRLTRLSYIISTASTGDKQRKLDTTTNADGSINTMTLTDTDGTTTTYTFGY